VRTDIGFTAMRATATRLPSGVRALRLNTHVDDRGDFTELFRDEWDVGIAPVQWNAVRSEAHVLRGVHVHPLHADALIVVNGRMRLGLSDLRTDSPTAGCACVLDLRGEEMQLVVIPPGVAHGFSFPVPSLHVYAVDHVWNPTDELGCRWDDPGLGIDWRHERRPRISPRDAGLPPLHDLRAQLADRSL
jgi:dTDP-4-dehydrorhamnose 3,5-epimerase